MPTIVLIMLISLLNVSAEAVPDDAAGDRCPPDEGKAQMLCAHAEALGRQIDGPAEGATLTGDPNIDVTHYFLDIEMHPEYAGETVTDVRVSGTCTITVAPVADGLATCGIDLYQGMNVVSVSGSVGNWSRVASKINVDLDRAYNADETFEIIIAYDGYPQSSGFGAFNWWTRNGDLVIATLSEPYYAHLWWPCKDALNDKATMEMHVTVPNWMVALSNGRDLGSVPLPGARAKFMWEETYPMIPYLASLAITNYERYDLQFPYDDGSGPQLMPVPCYVYSDHWDYAANRPEPAQRIGCAELPDMLETLSGKYGLYPFVNEKYGVVETGGFGGLGASMEHQTLSSMSRVSNFSDIMAHELAHQWWGDEVTCETWFDIWLNEGFASYSEAIYREFKPGGGIDGYWSRIDSRRPYFPDGRVYRTDIDGVWGIFDGNDVYNKGAWVLHMLRHVLGDDAFFTALNDYRETFRHDSVTTDEFAAAISASFGHDVSWFTDQWVMSFGSPDYDWNYASDVINGQYYLKLRIAQAQAAQGYGLFTMPVDVRVTTAMGSSVYRVWNDDWTEHYVIPLDAAPINVEFDEDGGTNYRNWILWDTRDKVTAPVQGPPVVVDATVNLFAGADGETMVEIFFSEDVANIAVADVTLIGATSGAHAPALIVYSQADRSVRLTYADLPDDAFTLTILSAGVTANGQALDGEISDVDWWDDMLLPSGDGQPGGDAIVTFNVLTGDGDGDGDIDVTDYAQYDVCFTGPDSVPYVDGCGAFDFDRDRDIDMQDFAAFQIAFTGP